MEGSKIRLSHAEMELVANAELILTKNRIIGKAIALLENVNEELCRKVIGSEEIFSVPPKISKGENYLGLPYAVLDFPRLSASGDLCFIRSMFWWGHYFSSTLHVQGSYRQRVHDRVITSFDELAEQEYYMGVHSNQWVHHFEQSNYVRLKETDAAAAAAHFAGKPFIKIAKKIPLELWEDAPAALIKSWNVLAGLIA